MPVTSPARCRAGTAGGGGWHQPEQLRRDPRVSGYRHPPGCPAQVETARGLARLRPRAGLCRPPAPATTCQQGHAYGLHPVSAIRLDRVQPVHPSSKLVRYDFK